MMSRRIRVHSASAGAFPIAETLNTGRRAKAPMVAVSDEAQVDAELTDLDRSMEELKKKRAELLRAKEAIRWAKTTASVSKTTTPQPVSPASAMTAAVPTKALREALDSLEWSSFKKKEGEWTFLRNRDGTLVDALTSETDFVNRLRKGETIVVGRYRYAASEDKFLNRHFEV